MQWNCYTTIGKQIVWSHYLERSRRNHRHLIPIHDTKEEEEEEEEEDDTDIYVDPEDIVEPNQPNEENSKVPQNSGSVNRWFASRN